MLARSRLRLFVLVCAAALGVGCETASASFVVDTSRLPRISGSREVYATPSATSFTTREPMTRAFELTASALIDDDWQPYDDPSAARTSDDSVRSMSFKKEGRAVSVQISTTPSQANATSVRYMELSLRNDLPFPKDATRIKFDADRAYLSFITARDAESTLAFFRDELRGSGWKLWSSRDGAPQADGGIAGELTGNGATAYYVRDNSRPLMLALVRREGSGFNVELKMVSPDQLARREGTSKEAAGEVARLIPVPQASEDVDFDGARGTLTFSNRASALIVAEYYRSKLQQLGWQERPASAADSNTTALRFTNGSKELSIAIGQAGPRSKVTVEGSGLQVAAALSRSM
jgi:hypothetical protein